MQLVTKGQAEGDECEKTERNLINAATNDAEMYSKQFLQEAASSINTALERPPIAPVNSAIDKLRFMCVDIDTYADRPPKGMPSSM